MPGSVNVYTESDISHVFGRCICGSVLRPEKAAFPNIMNICHFDKIGK